MNEGLELVLRAVLIGVVATAMLDLWLLLLNRAFGIATTNWARVGRWIGHFPRGQFMHANMSKVEPIRGDSSSAGVRITSSA